MTLSPFKSVHNSQCHMLLTIKDIAAKDIAARLQVNDKTIYAWAAQGTIPALRINGVIRFEDRHERWLQACHLLPLSKAVEQGQSVT